MKKFFKIAGIVLATLLVLMILLPFAFKGKVKGILLEEANKKLLAKVSFTDLRMNFFTHFPNITATINDLAVVGVDSFAMDTLVYAKDLSLAINLKSLLTNQGFSIKMVEMDNARILAKVLPDGRVNWDIMKPDTVKNSSEDTSVIHLEMKKIRINHTDVVYEDQEGNMKAEIKNWSGVLTGDLNTDKTLLKTQSSISALSFTRNGMAILRDATLDADMSMDADLTNSTFTFRSNRILLNAMEVSFNGFVQFPDTSIIRMNLAMGTEKVSFKHFLSLIPALYRKDFESLKTSGNLKLSAWIKGDMSEVDYPAFDLKMQVEKGMFQYPSLPKAVKDITIDTHIFNKGGSLDNTIVDVSAFHFNMAGNPFDMTLFVATPMSDPNVKGTMRGILNLSQVNEVYPLEKGTNLKGQMEADISAAGRLSYLDKKQYDRFMANGNLTLRGFCYTLTNMPEITIREAKMSFSPKAMALTAFSMNVGKNDIEATGSLTNMLSYFLKNDVLSGSLNMTSSYLNLNDFMTKDSTVSTDTLPLLAFEIPRNLHLSLKASGKKVLFSKLVMTNALGDLIVKDGRVTIQNLSANALGGSIGLNGYYEAVIPDKPQVAFGMDLKQVSFSETFNTFEAIKKLAPIFENIQGNYSMNLNFTSALNKYMDPDLKSINGNGLLQSNNLKVSNVKVLDMLANTLKKESLKTISPKDLKVSFKISDGKVYTSPFNVNVADMKVNLSGITGLDKSINYDVKLTLPQNMSFGGVSNLEGTITGSFSNPKLNLNRAAIAQAAATVLADQLLQKVTGNNLKQTVETAKEDFSKKAEEIRNQAKIAGDKLISEAEIQGNALIDRADNPLVKAGAKVAAKKIKTEAEKKAQALLVEAENKIKTLGN